MGFVKFIDLFAGTGGIRLAFEQALKQYGLKSICVKSVEIDDKACETYKLNFGDSPFGDVREVTDIEPFDVLLAGFPCQALSYAGKQQGFADTRGTLFFEVERLLKKYHPRLCFLENVRGLTTHDGGKTFSTILERLTTLGYNVEYRLINASTFGVPQNRTRIYIVCSLNVKPEISIESDLGAVDSHAYKSMQPTLFGRKKKHLLVNDVLEENPDKCYDCSEPFRTKLDKITKNDFTRLHGVRLIDTRHGNSIHSWDIGLKGDCTKAFWK
jgi:DNA (cytosine-5)-methyltransferase 1